MVDKLKIKNKTVKRRIFISNALMVLVTLISFLVINVAVIKIYSESVENELKDSAAKIMNKEMFEQLVSSFTIHRNEFILLFIADGIFCIVILLIVSQIFTKKLTKHIMDPLNALTESANRIQANDLSERIEYTGDQEFENVCSTFNDMQEHILTEQEKNRAYEKARADMIAGISHDLKTPLTAVKGTIKGLIDGVAVSPQQQNKFLHVAYKRTNDMDILLNRLFYLSKLETGNMPMSPKIISVNKFICNYIRTKEEIININEEGADVSKESACSGQEKIICDVPEADMRVYADTEQLYRIFDNLYENSRKYAQTQPLVVKIKAYAADDSVYIDFKDNGVGVPEEKMPYIFDEFYRGDESRNKENGNGLGLYIVKYLIEAMGGSVSARNEEGFVVCIKLPLAKTT